MCPSSLRTCEKSGPRGSYQIICGFETCCCPHVPWLSCLYPSPRQKHPQVKSPLRSSLRLQQKTPVLTPPRQKHPEVTSRVRSSPRLHPKTPVCTPPRQKPPQVISPVCSSPRLHQKTINSFVQRVSPPSTPRKT